MYASLLTCELPCYYTECDVKIQYLANNVKVGMKVLSVNEALKGCLHACLCVVGLVLKSLFCAFVVVEA